MGDDTERCLNCETPLQGPFCHACGQRKMDMRIALWRLALELIGESFEADGKLLRTLPRFFATPGQLVRDFVDGKRARYTSPVRILVFALAIGFLAMGFASGRSLDRVEASLEDRPFVIEAGKAVIAPEGGSEFALEVEPGTYWEAQLEQLEGMNQGLAARVLLDKWLDGAPTVAMALIPVLTLILAVLYPRYLIIEHLLLSTLLHAQGLLWVGFAVVVGWTPLSAVVLLWLGGQLFVGMHHVYGQPREYTAAKGTVALGVYLVVLLFAFVASMALAIQAL